MFPLCVEDYRRLARARLPDDVWDFIDGGSGAERTLAANRAAFDRVELIPRVMVDVSVLTTGTTLFGSPLRAPLGVAPTAYHQLVHPDGEVGTAQGAGSAGALFIVAMLASRTLEEIAAVATGPLWLQVYWLRRRDALVALIDRAESAGYQALVLTVDAPVLGRRRRDLRNGFAIDPAVRAVNLDAALMASTHERRASTSAIATHAERAFDPTLSWTDLAWLLGRTNLPIVLKGILTAQDARLALAHGASGIIVSNHGGRQLDGVTSSLAALSAVASVVDGRCPVLFDGGVRCGTDVFVALALGADTVLIGRPMLWALALAGAAGAAGLLELLREELANTMALAGRPHLDGIDASAVWRGAG